ncbi:4-(cytidine 5'-diphospho)-2-C-methyl-D-erythritol kinase [Halalkalibaculum sp. DA3122]|uniref:4-(cytidine 5'-diphospho)-2-C-methyl-D-erythritol kinase n=1 Tax=Halalkalibaculum sp. DA3122 TaxID=3373607 RepID=UPI003754ACD0
MKWIADSYAKINLGLHVLERLPTGYHRIETGFGFINWSDRFEVQKASRWQLELDTDDETISAGEDNLINRAVRQLKKYVEISNAYHINVDKRIPAGGGLGGGSSNAALILRMLNKIENLGLTDEELADLGRDLGADVPLFIKGQAGIGSGVGHEIRPLDIQPDYWIITCFPNVKSSTPEAYRHCRPNPEPEFELEKTLTETDPEEWRFTLQNDLEQSVLPRNHIVGNMKDQFYEFGALYASMSGSGSSVYGLFEQDFVATNAYHGFVDLGFPTNITKPGFKPDRGIYQKE